jgi:hypothetical protein
MAYNVLRGTLEFSDTTTGSIESMVDDWSVQTVAGIKTFSNTLSASAFWDTASETFVTTPAIKTIASDGAGRVIISDGDGTATCYSTLTFTDNSLTASYYSGSGVGLTNIPPDQFSSALPAASIDYGNGLTASSDTMTVQGGDGITVDASGVAVTITSNGGAGIAAAGIIVDPTNATDITNGGQNLADYDVLLVQDASHGLRKTTLTNLYSNYIAAKLPPAAITSYTNSTDNRVLTSVNSTTVNGETNLTFDGSTLAVTGDISGSGHTSIDKLSIGEDTSSTRLYVTSQADNEVVAIFKSPSHDTILACTGSGQVVVGGLYLAAKLNITGSDTDKLISAKSDSADPAFYVSGSGDAYISGSLRAKQLSYTTHKFSPGSDALVYLRFDTVGIDTAPTNNNKMVAPHNGKLIKVVWRFEGAGTGASTTTAFSLHAGVTNQQQIQATPVATINLNQNFIDDTTYTATFLDTAMFASGDIVGVSINPAFDPGITVVTCVWEFDQNN